MTGPAIGARWRMVTGFTLRNTPVVTRRATGAPYRVVIHVHICPIRVTMTGFTGRAGRGMCPRPIVVVTAGTARTDQGVINCRASPAIGLMASAAITDSLNMIARFTLGNSAIMTCGATGTGDRIVVHSQAGPTWIAMTRTTGVTCRGMPLRQIFQMATLTTVGNTGMIEARTVPTTIPMTARTIIGGRRMVPSLTRSEPAVMTADACRGYPKVIEL